MKIAVVTNNERTVANHIGICKKIAIYEDGEKIEVVNNPAMEDVKNSNLTLGNERERHLGTGSVLPQFLANKDVSVLIATEFRSQVLEQNLQRFGVLPYITEERDIETVLKNFNEEDVMRGFNRGFGQAQGTLPGVAGLGRGAGRGFGQAQGAVPGVAGLGRGQGGTGRGQGAGAGRGRGAGMGRGRGAGQGRGFGN